MKFLSLYWLCIFLPIDILSQMPNYQLDPSFSPEWPPEIEVNGVTAVATVETEAFQWEVHIAHHGSPAVMVFDMSGGFIRSWGDSGINKAHGLSAQYYAPHGIYYLWLTDMGTEDGKYGHTIHKYTTAGKLVATLGTPGIAGNGTDPIQFGNVADVAFDNDGGIYVADGDGGVNNRVVKFTQDLKVDFIINHNFFHPHSIALDYWNRIWVADRENNQTQVFDPSGDYLGSWNCTQQATGGRPWGLRIFKSLKFSYIVIIDGTEGAAVVLSLSGPTFSNKCNQLQVIPINRTTYGNPHEMAMDTNFGMLYVAEVNDQHQPTGCQRYKPNFESN